MTTRAVNEGWFVVFGSLIAGSIPEQGLVTAHVKYIQSMRRERRVLAAGPFAVSTDRLRIYRAADLEEARALVMADPYVEAGHMTYRIERWLLHESFSQPFLDVLERSSRDSADPASFPPET